MRLSGGKTGSFQDWPNELIVKPWHLIEKFAVLNVVTFLVTAKLHIVGNHLFLWDVFEYQEVGVILVIIVASAGLPALIIEEALSTRMSSTHWRIHSSICNCCWTIDWIRAWSRGCNTFALILKFFELVHALTKLPLSFFFLNWTFTNCIHSFPVYKVACTWSSSKFTIHTLPMLFEIRLNVLKPIKSRHLTRFLWWLLLTTSLIRCLSLRWHLTSKPSLRWLKTASLTWAHNLPVLWSILRAMPLILFRITARVRIVGRVLTIIIL